MDDNSKSLAKLVLPSHVFGVLIDKREESASEFRVDLVYSRGGICVSPSSLTANRLFDFAIVQA
jgi:hypothetical protein